MDTTKDLGFRNKKDLKNSFKFHFGFCEIMLKTWRHRRFGLILKTPKIKILFKEFCKPFGEER